MSRTGEDTISQAVCVIARGQPDNLCRFSDAYKMIPTMISLTPGDKEPSQTRPGEQMWQQIVRNIRSHHADHGNFIYEGYLESVPDIGYKITPAGVAYLNKLGI